MSEDFISLEEFNKKRKSGVVSYNKPTVRQRLEFAKSKIKQKIAERRLVSKENETRNTKNSNVTFSKSGTMNNSGNLFSGIGNRIKGNLAKRKGVNQGFGTNMYNTSSGGSNIYTQASKSNPFTMKSGNNPYNFSKNSGNNPYNFSKTKNNKRSKGITIRINR